MTIKRGKCALEQSLEEERMLRLTKANIAHLRKWVDWIEQGSPETENTVTMPWFIQNLVEVGMKAKDLEPVSQHTDAQFDALAQQMKRMEKEWETENKELKAELERLKKEMK